MLETKRMGSILLQNYLDQATSICLAVYTDHTIGLVNKRGCDIFGYGREEMLGKDWFQSFIPHADRKRLSHFFDQIINGNIELPEVCENWILTQGNIRKLVRWRNTLLKDGVGEILGIISSGEDVTRQTIVEREPRTSEIYYKSILQTLPDTIIICDVKGAFLDIMTTKESEILFPEKDTIGENIRDMVLDKGECDRILRTLTTVNRTKETKITETWISSLGRVMNFEVRVVPFEREKLLVVLRDITLSKTFEDIMHTRNRALEAAGNGIVIVDAKQPKLPIIYCNMAFTEMTGYSREEVMGINCQFLQNDDRDQEAIERMTNAIRKGEPCKVVLRNYRKDGTLFWNEISITPLYDDQNHLTHFIGVQNDVTETLENRNRLENYAVNLELKIKERTEELQETVRKLVHTNLSLENQIVSTKIAQEKARASQAMYTAIAQNFPKGIIVVFNTNYELVFVEGEELERIALKKSDFENVDIDRAPFFSKLPKVNIREDVTKTLNGTAISSEIYFQGQNYTVNSTPLYSDQMEIIWALFVYNNVTEQKRVQQNLEKTLKAEQELNDLKSRFVSMASHEFRTPLSTILSSAILIGKQNGPGMEERREKHVSRIRNSVKSLVLILNDFLSMEVLEEGRIKVDPKHFELIQFSKLLIEEMEGHKKGGQYISLDHPRMDILVYMDAKALGHILINLLSNALKYSKEGQEISMKISRTSNEVLITVTDKGMGIPQEEQKKLFERFFRATNVANIQGTGLGLHIVKQYTVLLGGAISFTSKLGIGTSFTIKLPLKSQPPRT